MNRLHSGQLDMRMRRREVPFGCKMAHHLPCRHADSLDRKLSPAHIEQILQTWSEEVNYQDIVQAFLTKVVYLGYPSYNKSSRAQEDNACMTDCSLPESGRSDIRREVVVLQPFWVPNSRRIEASVPYNRGWFLNGLRTNLMATVWELRRLVPV